MNGDKIAGLILGTCSTAKANDLNLNRLVDDANAFSRGLLRVADSSDSKAA